MTTIETYKIAGEGISLSLLIWRRFKRPMIGMVERVLKLNPGIAADGAHLKVGTIVKIPIDPPPTSTTTSRPVVQLWD